MIGEDMRSRAKTQHTEQIEKALGIANTGHRMDLGMLAQECPGIERFLRGQGGDVCRSHYHGVCPTPAAPSADHEIHLLEASGRLAQRTLRQTASITKTTLAVHHNNFSAAGQGIVLQPIVADYQIRAVLTNRHIQSVTAVRVQNNRHPGATGDEHRLVSHFQGIAVRRDLAGILIRLASESPGYHCHLQSTGNGSLDQGDHQRGLAGTAHGDITDDQHRHRRYRPLLAEPLQPALGFQ